MYKNVSNIYCMVISVKLKNLNGQNDMGYVILESEDSNWERKKSLLGWAAKSSAWEEPNDHWLNERIAVQYWRQTCGIAVYSKLIFLLYPTEYFL